MLSVFEEIRGSVENDGDLFSGKLRSGVRMRTLPVEMAIRAGANRFDRPGDCRAGRTYLLPVAPIQSIRPATVAELGS